jgi:RimJ/RimL family protein N-acetyltransferase
MSLAELTFPIFTQRLGLRDVAIEDAAFILDLFNSPGWLQFIGDRQIHTLSDAEKYIQGIQIKTNVKYYVVQHLEQKTSMGLITLIKREYLEQPDLGFAFLPQFTGHGFALEASSLMLTNILNVFSEVFAITVPENISSIKLLGKLGFHFVGNVPQQEEVLHLFRFVSRN